MNGQTEKTVELIRPQKAMHQETKAADLTIKTATDTGIEITRANDNPDNLSSSFYVCSFNIFLLFSCEFPDSPFSVICTQAELEILFKALIIK